MFYTSIGVLQRDAPLKATSPDIPITAWTEEQINTNEKEGKSMFFFYIDYRYSKY